MNSEYLSASGRRSSGFKKLGRASIASISVLLILLISASCVLAWPVTELKITPESPCAYDGNITITGKVGPNEIVTITTTYVKEVDVTNGKYEYDPGIVQIPKGTTFCSITAESVKDMTITTNLFKFIPISKTQEACSNKAGMSVSSPLILPGNYTLLISGNAADKKAVTNCNDGNNGKDDKGSVKTVAITFVAKMDVKADANGYFKQVCCTNRPPGKYTLKIGDKTRVVNLRDCSKQDGKTTVDAVSGDTTSSTTTSSGGSGNAVVSSGVGTSSIGNATVNATVQQSVPDTNDYGPEDVADVSGTASTASASTNSIMSIIQAILNWLGF
ncbi:MAG: hypothetical protein ACC612_12365 [Methanomethylovorans sp.]|uniref:hypothetical protein n=1 Tax=Methanomethylovorans sp. TaxID=2758717 RepID=UPI0035307E49